MGQLGHRTSARSSRVPVVQPGESDYAGTHQRTVACRGPARVGDLAARGAEPVGGTSLDRAGGPEHRPSLVAHVSRAPGIPPLERGGDVVERRLAGEVSPGGRDAADAHSHLRVIAPLAGRVGAESATLHLRLAGRGSGELIGHAERVAARLREQDAGGAVGLLRGQVHPITSLSVGGTWVHGSLARGSGGQEEGVAAVEDRRVGEFAVPDHA